MTRKVKLEPFGLIGEGEIILIDATGKEFTLTLPFKEKQNE